MHAEFTINNILGVRGQATLKIEDDDKAVTVWGENVTGKTSMALGIAAALSAHNNGNFLSLPASRKSLYAHQGSDKAHVRADIRQTGTEEFLFSAKWDPYKGATMTCGEWSMPAVVGLEDPLLWKPQTWTNLFKNRVLSQELFDNAMAQVYGRATPEAMTQDEKNIAAELRKQIRQDGVDVVLARHKEHGANAKRHWEAATASVGEAERYGKQKGGEWRPRGWKSDQDYNSLEQARKAHQKARETHQRVVKHEAETKGQIKELKKQAEPDTKHVERLEAAACYVSQCKETYSLTHERHERAKEVVGRVSAAHHEALTRLREQSGMQCPKCKTLLVVDGNALVAQAGVKPAKVLQAEMERAHDDLVTAAKIEQDARRAFGEAHERLTDARVRHETVMKEKQLREQAKARLAEIKGAASPEIDIDTAAMKVEETKQFAQMVEAVITARKAHENVLGHAAIVHALSEGGVLSTAIAAQGIAKLQKVIERTSSVIGLESVALEEGSVLINGRPAQLCSENEQFNARLVLRTSLAFVFNQPIIIIDRLDTVVSPARREAVRKLVGTWVRKTTKFLFFAASSSAADAETFPGRKIHVNAHGDIGFL